MNNTDTILFLRNTLDEEDLIKLNSANQLIDLEDRLLSLRAFFNQPKIFNKIKVVIDPSWVCSEIIIKGKDYEF
jgi:hypothetical protein